MTTPRTGKRILVLDDAKRNRGLTRETFSPLGIGLLTASDSKRALEVLADGYTDVFVTDLQLSGVDFLIAVRQRFPDLPIIVMVGYNVGHLVADPRLGSIATTVLTEPMTPEDIVLAVRHLFLRRVLAGGADAVNIACDTKRPRVVLADDDRDIRRLLVMQLEKRDYDVTGCEDGVFALEAVESSDCDVLLTDIMMPRMDGIALTQKIKQLRPRLPVIVLSAARDVEASLNALRAGAYCYVIKPVNIKELSLFIDRAILTGKLQSDLREQNSLLGKRAEELGKALNELRQQADLYIASRLSSLKKLSANVAHELKNPLNSINASFSYVRSHIPPDALAANPKIVKHCGIIETQIRRSTDIIEGMLNFARPDATNVADIQVNDLIQESIRSTLPDHDKIKVRWALDPTLPVVRASESKLELVFGNLIINAAKAMKNSGTLAIKSQADGAGNIRIIIADTGPGIPASIIHKIFDPFFTTDQTQGTGLGLAICRETIKQCGGRITASNGRNAGAVFTITLPPMQHEKVAVEAGTAVGVA